MKRKGRISQSSSTVYSHWYVFNDRRIRVFVSSLFFEFSVLFISISTPSEYHRTISPTLYFPWQTASFFHRFVHSATKLQSQGAIVQKHKNKSLLCSHILAYQGIRWSVGSIPAYQKAGKQRKMAVLHIHLISWSSVFLPTDRLMFWCASQQTLLKKQTFMR